MKLVINKDARISVEKSDRPVMKEGESIVKVKACGICGSDVPRVFANKAYFYPIVLGHEFSGIVEESENKDLIGKRVCVFPILPCGKCEFCQKEQYANCEHYDYYGSRRCGGMQDRIAVKNFNLVELPERVSYEAGAMTEPCAVCLHALKKLNIERGKNVVIYGAGTIGLLCGNWARSFGAGEVYFVDLDERKLRFAEDLGYKRYNGERVGYAIEASGAGACLNSAISSVEPFGKIVLVGNTSGDVNISKDNYSKILRKQLSLFGSWNSDFASYSNDWKETLSAMAAGIIQPEKIITHRFSLREGATAFKVIENRDFYNKIMLLSD